jgi:hypothetical protein
MAGYGNDLRLKEITTGDEDGTWGTSTNTNLSLIADAFSLGTKQMAADADETFTMPDAVADGTRSLYLKITSAVSLTVTRTVTLAPNTVSKVWIIENATTGSQIITIAQGSGATVNVPSGSKLMIVTDGAGATAAVFNANPTVSLASGVTGTLPVANGGTGATSLTANNVILGNGTSAVGFVAPGTTGNVLTSNGTTWVSQAASGGSLLGVTDSTTPFLTALGYNAGAASGAGTVRNTFLGFEAGAATNTGDDNTVTGYQAFTANTSGFGSSAFGRSALAAATTGSNNTGIGDRSLTTATTCINNTAVGARSAFSATTGGNNTAMGYNSLYTNSTSASNTAIGYEALYACTAAQNTALGANAGTALVSGANNTIIGFNAAASSTSVSNEITLGNASITAFRIPGVGLRFDTTDGLVVPKTITAAATTGAQTINKTAGSVNFAAAATSLVVTNSFVDANSVIIATVATNDSTMVSVQAVPASGSFTLYANAAATAETRVNWVVIN